MVRVTQEGVVEVRMLGACMTLSSKYDDHESRHRKKPYGYLPLNTICDCCTMTRNALEQQIREKKSLLCVGIDPVQERMPKSTKIVLRSH